VAHASWTLYADRPDRAGEIAMHYERGGDAERAAAAYATAASHALQLYANDEAVAFAERAFALSGDASAKVGMQMIRGRAGESLGKSEIRASTLDALAKLPVTPAQLPEVERLRTIHAMVKGTFDEASLAARRFLAAALAIHDDANIVQAHIECANAAINGDRYEEAEEHLRMAADALAPDDDRGRLRILRARTLFAQRVGAHDAEFADAAQRLLDGARRVGDLHSEAEAHVRLAHVAMNSGRFEEARREYDSAREVYRRFGSPMGLAQVDLNDANLATWAADYERSRALYRKCLAFAEENESQTNTLVSAIGLALADIYTGQPTRASETIEGVAYLAVGRRTNEEAIWSLCKALIASELSDTSAAVFWYDAALAMHRPKAPVPLFAVSLAFAAHAALDAGDEERAVALEHELSLLPERLMSTEEFPHLMLWARARVAALRGDDERASGWMHASIALYEARARAIGDGAAAYAAIPWNARFLQLR
jgi:tetratricopeptide (TPR) repeat protein